MKFSLLVTALLDIFIKEKNNTFIFLGFLLCDFSMQCKECLFGQTKRKGTLLTVLRPSPDIATPRLLYFTQISKPLLNRTPFPRLFGTLE